MGRARFSRREKLITKSRMIVAPALAVAVAAAGIAVAGTTGADLNDASVVSKVTPSKLDKKKFKPVNVLLGVVNSPDSAGNEDANAAAERIAWSKNVKVNLNKAPRCTTPLANGTTTQFAKSECPAKSFLGGGTATVHGPGSLPQCGGTPCQIADPVVSVFNGPGPNQLRLHTFSDELQGASPIVNARIVRANQRERNQGYGQALSVPAAPVTATLKITSFKATIRSSRKVATAKCKPNRFKVLRRVTYTDGSSETATLTQRCRVKKRK